MYDLDSHRYLSSARYEIKELGKVLAMQLPADVHNGTPPKHATKSPLVLRPDLATFQASSFFLEPASTCTLNPSHGTSAKHKHQISALGI
jgi:hypothetical protein